MLSRLLPRVTWRPLGSLTGGDMEAKEFDEGPMNDLALGMEVESGPRTRFELLSFSCLGESGGVLRPRSRSVNDIVCFLSIVPSGDVRMRCYSGQVVFRLLLAVS